MQLNYDTERIRITKIYSKKISALTSCCARIQSVPLFAVHDLEAEVVKSSRLRTPGDANL